MIKFISTSIFQSLINQLRVIYLVLASNFDRNKIGIHIKISFQLKNPIATLTNAEG